MKTFKTQGLVSSDETELQQLHSSANSYLSELDFFEDEIKFLKDLMEEKFLFNINDAQISRVQLLYTHLKQLAYFKKMANEDALLHEANIEAKFMDKYCLSGDFLKLEDKLIEQEVENLLERFKNIKIEILNLSRKQMLN